MKGKEITKHIAIRNVRGRSINDCFIVLGASEDEIYLPMNTRRKRKKDQTIYSRYSKDDLEAWAYSLWKKAIIASHPDRGGNPTNARNINEAYQRIIHILKYKKNE